MATQLLSVPQLAAETAESQAVWRKRLFRREIRFVKLGRNVRVHRQDLDLFLAARQIAAWVESKPTRGERTRGVL
jgi:excisionase family DNA binding protein